MTICAGANPASGLNLVGAGHVFADVHRSQPDHVAGVRLREVATVIEDDVPIGSLFRVRCQIIRQQRLGEILRIDLLAGALLLSGRAAYMIWRALAVSLPLSLAAA